MAGGGLLSCLLHFSGAGMNSNARKRWPMSWKMGLGFGLGLVLGLLVNVTVGPEAGWVQAFIDWVTNPATAITFGGTPMGADGGLDLAFNTSLVMAGAAQSPAAAGILADALAAAMGSRMVLSGGATARRALG